MLNADAISALAGVAGHKTRQGRVKEMAIGNGKEKAAVGSTKMRTTTAVAGLMTGNRERQWREILKEPTTTAVAASYDRQ